MLRSLFHKPDADSDLVAAARRGDARAFDALVCRYLPQVKQFVRVRSNAQVDPDDVVQEVFLAAWKAIPGFAGRSQFKTWLFGIAANLTSNAARKSARQASNTLECTDLEEQLAEPAVRAGEAAWSAVVQSVVIKERLAQLENPGREVLELYYYADLNLREIADVLEVNLSTLKYWFYQAHRSLRAAMADLDPALDRPEPAECLR